VDYPIAVIEVHMTSLLDFYQQHNISPVRQDITDLPAHFARRAGLYRSLGLPPMAVKGKTVLEVGPGSGENALYTVSLKPLLYRALEPNKTAAQKLLDRFPPTRTPIVGVIHQRVEDFDRDRRFDIVLCEGLLGLCGTDPRQLLEAVAKHVAPDGVLVITCIDAISDHAEVLRRAQAQQLIDRSAPLADQVAILRPVFAPHLATLKGMTRSVDDWIIDNLLNPASIGPTFSIPEACEALGGRFDVLGCSPRFLMDWRWYKDSPAGNQWAIDAYWAQAHNLLDYRSIRPPRAEADNRALLAGYEKYREELRAYEHGHGRLPNIGTIDPAWFGRGQQYLSFVRHD
jgi:SAM-dependent methyltransferase